eukprot:630563-Prorocentrum_minimum.AAC.2
MQRVLDTPSNHCQTAQVCRLRPDRPSRQRMGKDSAAHAEHSCYLPVNGAGSATTNVPKQVSAPRGVSLWHLKNPPLVIKFILWSSARTPAASGTSALCTAVRMPAASGSKSVSNCAHTASAE